MELLQLRYFCTVARMQNISHAAAYHQIPQPAMSKTISKLEKELGAPLFLREKNRLHLSPQGQRFYARVAAALQELDGALDELRPDHEDQQLQLQLLVTALRGKTAEFLALFRRRYPNVSFQVTSTMPAASQEPLYDLCITDEQPSPEYDSSFPLMTRNVEIYVAVSRTHPLAKKDVVRLEDLEDVPILAISTSPILRSVLQLYQASGMKANVAITCDDLQCLQRYIRSGIGVSFSVAYSWTDMVDPQIRFIKMDLQLPQQIRVYWSGKTPRSKIWYTLVDQLQQYFAPTATYWEMALDRATEEEGSI